MIENNNLTVNEAQALYFDELALREPAKKLYRFNNHESGRHYFSMAENGGIDLYTSVTNMIRQTMPTPYALIQWIAKMGQEEAENYRDERAGYGTFMHILFTELLLLRRLNLEEINETFLKYCEENKYTQKQYDKWLPELKRDVIGFAQFVLDYNIVPYAIEVVLASEKYGVAGAVDLACQITIPEKGFWGEKLKNGPNKGEPKATIQYNTYNAIIDYKSSRKGFHEEHEIQLEAYRQMWNENFPDVAIDKLYNYSPSEWRSEPGYTLKDQTNSPNRFKFPHMAEIAKIEASKRSKTITSMSGLIDLNAEEANVASVIKTVSIEEYIQNKTIQLKASLNHEGQN